MSNADNIKYFVYKRMVHVIKVGPIYIWNTASTTKSDCIDKALKHFKIKSERFLKFKGAEIIKLFIKEIRVQENNSNKSV